MMNDRNVLLVGGGGSGRFGNVDFDTDVAGGGSHVCFRVGHLDVDVNSSLERLGDARVLVPRVVLTLGQGIRWDLFTMRLSDRSLWDSSSRSPFASGAPPRGTEQRYRRLAERSCRFSVGTGFLDVRAQPLHATFNSSGEFGRDDFDVQSMVEVVERACAFVEAATSAGQTL